jgi:D-sedoheptulose 7-phosphate isomerase
MHPRLKATLDMYPDLSETAPAIEAACQRLVACYRGGGKVLICGNGGSAADAEHLVGELMKSYLRRRPIPLELRNLLETEYGADGDYLAQRLAGALPTISLVSQTGLLTALANDVAADVAYAQQVIGYGRPGDVLVGISTSGQARNVLHAVRLARLIGLGTIGITGRDGGALRGLVDVAVCAPHDDTATIQERHLAIYHALCAMIEEDFFPE